MSRRSEPMPPGDWWTRRSEAERAYSLNVRATRENYRAVIYVTRDRNDPVPEFACTKCRVLYNPNQFDSCPQCACLDALRHREAWKELMARQMTTFTSTAIH